MTQHMTARRGEVTFLTAPEDLTTLVKDAREFLQIIAILDPRVSTLDPDDAATRALRKRPDIKPYMQNLASEGQAKREYLNAQGRLVWLLAEFPYATIFPFILEHDPNRVFMKQEKKTKKNARDPNEKQEYTTREVKGWVRCGCIVWDGCGRFSIGEKTEDAEGFGDYIEKALTGAFGRAVIGLGIGTQFANDFRERYVVDAPVEIKAAYTDVETHNGNGHSTHTRADTPLKGSIPVTTRETVMPTIVASIMEVPDYVATKATIEDCQTTLKTLVSDLSKEAIQNLAEYRIGYHGLPEKTKDWDLPAYELAITATQTWLAPVEQNAPTQVQRDMLDGYRTMLSRPVVEKFCARVCSVTTAQLNSARMTYLLELLREHAMFYAYAMQVDLQNGIPFKHLQATFTGVETPLDLVLAKRKDLLGAYEVYRLYLKDQFTEEMLSDAFKTQYKDEYHDLLQ